MELKILILLMLLLPFSALAQFLPDTWTEQERAQQLIDISRQALEERKHFEKRAMEIKAAHQKKLELEKKANSED